MDFIQQLHTWAKGDVLQGRWMAGIAILALFPIIIFVFKSDGLLVRGMLIPLCLLSIMNLGYGGYLMLTKSKYIEKTENKFRKSPEETFRDELASVKADDKSYSLLKPVWAMSIVVCIILHFLFKQEYFKGLTLGFIGLFFGMLLIDTFLHNRLTYYYTVLQNMLNP